MREEAVSGFGNFLRVASTYIQNPLCARLIPSLSEYSRPLDLPALHYEPPNHHPPNPPPPHLPRHPLSHKRTPLRTFLYRQIR